MHLCRLCRLCPPMLVLQLAFDGGMKINMVVSVHRRNASVRYYRVQWRSGIISTHYMGEETGEGNVDWYILSNQHSHNMHTNHLSWQTLTSRLDCNQHARP